MRILLLFTLLTVISCGKSPVPNGNTYDLRGYDVAKVKGTNTEFAVQKSESGALISEGMVTNGVQNGIWVTYFEGDENKMKTIANYVNGSMNGPYMEMNNRGQLEKRITYLNNQIHGLYSEYKFGRPLKEYNYDSGILDGLSKEYNDRGKLVKETNYKQGQLHGTIKQYDEGGALILEYEYKNGEKISGGIVTPPAE